MKKIIASIIFLLSTIMITNASATSYESQLVPNPSCVAAAVLDDEKVASGECLIASDSVELNHAYNVEGHKIATKILTSTNDQIYIKYNISLIQNLNSGLKAWPVTVEINTGGSGWFSSAAMLVGTPNNEIVAAITMPLGDRCNDGNPSWFKIELPLAYVSTCSTIFRLINPEDNKNWRMIYNAALFQQNETIQDFLLGKATLPLYENWLPYDQLNNAALNEAGRLINIYDLSGVKFEGAKFNGVIFNPATLQETLDKTKFAENCFSKALAANGPIGEWIGKNRMFISREDWLNFRNSVKGHC